MGFRGLKLVEKEDKRNYRMDLIYCIGCVEYCFKLLEIFSGECLIELR